MPEDDPKKPKGFNDDTEVDTQEYTPEMKKAIGSRAENEEPSGAERLGDPNVEGEWIQGQEVGGYNNEESADKHPSGEEKSDNTWGRRDSTNDRKDISDSDGDETPTKEFPKK